MKLVCGYGIYMLRGLAVVGQRNHGLSMCGVRRQCRLGESKNREEEPSESWKSRALTGRR
jgi:hypothetical protein